MFINELKRFLIFCFVRKFSPFMPLLRKIFSTCYIIFILIRKWIKLQTVPKLSLFDNEKFQREDFCYAQRFLRFWRAPFDRGSSVECFAERQQRSFDSRQISAPCDGK